MPFPSFFATRLAISIKWRALVWNESVDAGQLDVDDQLFDCVDTKMLIFFDFLFDIFQLVAGEATKQEDRATKEYSRIRQLSADQYGSQYGVTHDPSGRRPQEKHQPRNTMAVRPLFA